MFLVKSHFKLECNLPQSVKITIAYDYDFIEGYNLELIHRRIPVLTQTHKADFYEDYVA